jgi:thiol:disulfide interchange protein
MLQSILGLALILAGVPIYMLMVDHPMLRRTAMPFWIMAAIGFGLTVSSILADRRIRVRVVSGISFVFIALFMFGFFVMSRVPDSPDFARLDMAPAFALADHTGRTVKLDEARSTGPVLIVFYRGHW